MDLGPDEWLDGGRPGQDEEPELDGEDDDYEGQGEEEEADEVGFIGAGGGEEIVEAGVVAFETVGDQCWTGQPEVGCGLG